MKQGYFLGVGVGVPIASSVHGCATAGTYAMKP